MNRSRLLKAAALAVALQISSAFALSVADITDITPKVDEKPVPVRTSPPRYPQKLKADGVEGLVFVVIVVDETGNVIASEISKASREEFKAPALEAVNAWKFKPATLAGKAVKVRVTIPLKFSIGD